MEKLLLLLTLPHPARSQAPLKIPVRLPDGEEGSIGREMLEL